MARAGRYVLGSMLVGYGALYLLDRQAGSTAQERRTLLPGDEAVPRPPLTNHAITIHAPSSDVWWWLKFRAGMEWTWSFRLAELPGGRTRLRLRVRGGTAPGWLSAAYQATIVPADYVMDGGMLRGIKGRAESGAPPRSSGRSPLAATHSAIL